MREILIVIGLLFVVLFAHADIHSEQTQTVLIENVGFMATARGSGILLDETHILTCAHMVSSPNDELLVYTYPLGSVIKAVPEYVDVKADLAILTLAQPVIVTVAPIFERHWVDGEAVTVIGNAMGSMKWVISAGVIASEDRQYLYTDARINHGNSGGPWFDASGNIVALSDFLIEPKEGAGIAGGISAGAIEAFLQERENEKKMAEVMGKLLGV